MKTRIQLVCVSSVFIFNLSILIADPASPQHSVSVMGVPSRAQVDVGPAKPIRQHWTLAGYAVSDPNIPYETILPSGSYDLTKYKATPKMLGDLMDQIPQLKNSPGWTKHKEWLLNPDSTFNDCTAGEIELLQDYTGDGATNLNHVLYNNLDGRVDGIPIEKYVELEILGTASALNCLPKKTATVYRGEAGLGFRTSRDFVPGNCVAFPSFVSTSTSLAVSDEFSQFKDGQATRFIITNAYGTDLGSTGISTSSKEHEVILPPGTILKVVDRKTEPGPSSAPDARRTVITLEQIYPKPPSNEIQSGQPAKR